jgi:hypothetical protein
MKKSVCLLTFFIFTLIFSNVFLFIEFFNLKKDYGNTLNELKQTIIEFNLELASYKNESEQIKTGYENSLSNKTVFPKINYNDKKKVLHSENQTEDLKKGISIKNVSVQKEEEKDIKNLEKKDGDEEASIEKISEEPSKIIKEEKYKKISWEISSNYKEIFGPFAFDDEFLFIYPDGSFNLINGFGIIKKKGRIEKTVSQFPVYENKKIYFSSNDGYISLYDFQSEKIRWSFNAGFISKIKPEDSKQFLLFSSPDKKSLLIHKKTGIVLGRQDFSTWDCPPVIFNDKIYVSRQENVDVYAADSNFAYLEKIKAPSKILNLVKNGNKLFLETKAAVYLFDGKNIDNNNFFEKIIVHSDSNILINKKETLTYVDGSLEKIDDNNPGSLIYYRNGWKIHQDSNQIIMNYDDIDFIIPEKKVYEIFQTCNSVILISGNNTIFCRGIE